jgi:hypothetical protein
MVTLNLGLMKIRILPGSKDYESWEMLGIFQHDRAIVNLLICNYK